jgi:hypothetical protein
MPGLVPGIHVFAATCYDVAMRSERIPFKFDLTDLLGKLHRMGEDRVGDVTLNLPFVSIGVSPKSREKKIARETVIRLKDRRVLSAWECCDDCIDKSLSSLQEIRRHLVDQQVALSDLQDGPLYAVLEAMNLGIRQFLTFEEQLHDTRRQGNVGSRHFRRDPETRELYFDALELLRGHLSRCLSQVAVLAGTKLPRNGVIAHYRGEWEIKAYVPPQIVDGRDKPGHDSPHKKQGVRAKTPRACG